MTYGIPIDVTNAVRVLVFAKYKEILKNEELSLFENSKAIEKIS